MEVVDIQQGVRTLPFALLLALGMFLIGRRLGYFRLCFSTRSCPVSFLQTGGIFLVYFLFAFIIFPLVYMGIVRLFDQNGLSKQWLGWAQILSIFFMFICLVIYCLLIRANARLFIFWGNQAPSAKRGIKALLMGLVSLPISYPFVLLTGIITSLISLLIWREAYVEQVAVRQLKMTMGYPFMFGFMIFLIVFLIPFIEELLFRGFLQSFLKRYLGRTWGIVTTALIFAFVHYAPSQGIGNFQLISSLFVLSLFLGFIYEKEQTLWACISLHAAFNSFSVILIIFQTGI